ncbi:unnamed protein product [Pylaiella littoralis]
MLSFIGEHLGAPENARGMPDRGSNQNKRSSSHPPFHPAATVEVGQLLDLGLALGHERFELVSLVGREEAGTVAAHAWAECGGGSSSSRIRDSDFRSSAVQQQQQQQSQHHRLSGTRTSRPRLPPVARSNARIPDERQELQTEVEWLRERVDNLSRELVLARKDCGRLAKQLKQEERLGREQRRKADDAVREAKALSEELDRLKKDRTASGAASRAALSDAHSRSVRMAERRRRQQAESLMQAYKGLYEDQQQAQHASAESYRSLTRGFSRLSADNKALRRETAAVAAVASDAGDTAGNAAALTTSSSADMQQTSSATSPSRQHATASNPSSRDEVAQSGKERRDKSGGKKSGGGSGVGEVESPVSKPAAATAAAASAAAVVRTAETAAVRVSDDSSCSSKAAHHEYASTAAGSAAAAVATAAVAVAAAAGALAEAATAASSTDDEGSAPPLLSPSLMKGRERQGGTAAAEECAKRDSGGQGCAVVGNSNSSRDQASSIRGSAEADRPSTAETVACSLYADNAEGSSPSFTTTQESTTTAAAKHGGHAATGSAGGTTFASDGRAPPADCCLSLKVATSRSGGALADIDHAGRRICNASSRGGGANDHAFPQTKTGEDERTFPAGDLAFSASAPRNNQDDPTLGSRDSGVGMSDERCFASDAFSESDERFPTRGGGGAGLRRLTKAAPPEEPAPRWRGRSGGPGRLLTSSVSRAEGVDVDAPKRSSSPSPPRRGRWGECVGGVGWGGGGGGGNGGARGHDECSRIEPSSRARPHSI